MQGKYDFECKVDDQDENFYEKHGVNHLPPRHKFFVDFGIALGKKDGICQQPFFFIRTLHF